MSWAPWRGTIVAAARFHAVGGARVALRNAAVVFSCSILMLMLVPDPPAFLRFVAGGVSTGDGSLLPLGALAIFALLLARRAAPQLAVGQDGWFRSLPLGLWSQRAALMLGLATVQLPLALLVAGCAVVSLVTGERLSGPRMAAALAALMVPGLWFGLQVSKQRPTRRRRASPGPTLTGAQRSWTLGLIWRALRWRLLALLPAVVLLHGSAWLYIRNNELTGAPARAAARLLGICAVTVYLGAVADTLARRRPAWPWARTLPWSARHRVSNDVRALALAGAGAALLTVLADRQAMLPVLAATPPLAALAVLFLPRAHRGITGVSGPLWACGFALAIVVAAYPVLSAAALATTPTLVHWAAWRERRTRLTRWDELFHDVSGDTSAWAAR